MLRMLDDLLAFGFRGRTLLMGGFARSLFARSLYTRNTRLSLLLDS